MLVLIFLSFLLVIISGVSGLFSALLATLPPFPVGALDAANVLAAGALSLDLAVIGGGGQ